MYIVTYMVTFKQFWNYKEKVKDMEMWKLLIGTSFDNNRVVFSG